MGRMIHEGSPSDAEEKYFISIAFSAEAVRIAALTNIKMGNAKIYEWKKETRIIAACSWLDELKKASKTDDFAIIRKITMDPNDKDQVCMTGKNHVRIWRNTNGILKPLPPISKLDTKRDFTDHVWLDNVWLVCGTDKGDVYFIYESKQCVIQANAFGTVIESVSCLFNYGKGLIIGGENGLISLWERKDLVKPGPSDPKDAIVFGKNLSKF